MRIVSFWRIQALCICFRLTCFLQKQGTWNSNICRIVEIRNRRIWCFPAINLSSKFTSEHQFLFNIDTFQRVFSRRFYTEILQKNYSVIVESNALSHHGKYVRKPQKVNYNLQEYKNSNFFQNEIPIIFCDCFHPYIFFQPLQVAPIWAFLARYQLPISPILNRANVENLFGKKVWLALQCNMFCKNLWN